MSAQISQRTNWKKDAEHWQARARSAESRLESVHRVKDALIEKLQTQVDELETQLERLESAEKEETVLKADDFDRIADLLSDYRIFGWIDRLNDALALATGERAA